MKNYLVIFTLTCLTACSPRYSEVPTATNFLATKQSVLQAAKHWDIIHSKVSDELINAINSKVNKSDRILINPENSAYSHQLNLDLSKALTQAGFRVVKYEPNHHQYKHLLNKNKPAHDIQIDLKTNVLRFDRERQETYTTGNLSLLSAGVWFLKTLSNSNWARGTVAIGGVDAYNYLKKDEYFEGATPQTEVVIDIAVSKQDEYISITKDIFYVIESDAAMYTAVKSSEPLMQEFMIDGGKR